MNDPYGIVHVAGEYHMFFQYVPGLTVWDRALHWGHAVSPDLVRWREVAPALSPQNEVGCWSGSVVFDDQGPLLFYTRPTEGDWGHGMVVAARATSGMDAWQRTPAGVLIDGPPPGQGFIEFRDPNVRRQDGRWVMVLGAGVKGDGGCVLQDSSDDLEAWAFDGLLAQPPEPGTTPLDTGTIWECPQFIQVDGNWVLLVSAADWADLSHVIYAIGDYDGVRFTPRTWGHFGYSRTTYATSAFTDAAGRPCAMSWVRESGPKDEAPEGSPWAGAQSLVHALHVVDDRLVVTQHPNLDDHLPATSTGPMPHASVSEVSVAGPIPWRVTLDLEQARDGALELEVVGSDASWRLRIDLTAQRLQVATPDTVILDADFLVAADEGRLDLVVDADIAELTWSAGEGVYVARVPAIAGPHVTIRR